MEHTKNYHLPQWVETDRIMMEDFNEAMEKIDAAVAAKADGEETAAAAAALEQRLAEKIGTGGFNCRIETGSYVGNGRYGKANAVEIVCDIHPLLIVVGAYEHAQSTLFPCVMLRGIDRSVSDNSSSEMLLEWTETGVKMWTSESSPDWMNNEANCEYFYVAFGV